MPLAIFLISVALLTPDHLGSSTVLTNETGVVIGRFSYRPFGGFSGPAPSPEPRALSDGSAIHHYFTGQELDASTDLYYLRARYYDPALGRFTQPDPVLNLRDPQNGPYTYARNNPLRLIDPTGLSFHSNLGSSYGVGGIGGGFGSGLGDFLSQSPLGRAWESFTNFTTQSFTSAFQSLNQTVTSSMQSFSGLIGQARSFGAELGQGFTNFLTQPQTGLLGIGATNLYQTTLRQGVNLLSQYGAPPSLTHLAGIAPAGLLADQQALSGLMTRPLQSLGALTIGIGGALTVNQLVRIFEDPTLTRGQQFGYSTAEVGAFGGKVGAGLAIARAAGLTAAFASGGPIAVPLAVTIAGTTATGVMVDVIKEALLRQWDLNR